MEIDLIFQIAGVGIVVAVINQLLSRAGRDELFASIKQIFNL